MHLMVLNDIEQLSLKLFKDATKKIRTVAGQLPVGEVVRIQTVRHTFSRATNVRNTYELFKAKTVFSSETKIF